MQVTNEKCHLNNAHLELRGPKCARKTSPKHYTSSSSSLNSWYKTGWTLGLMLFTPGNIFFNLILSNFGEPTQNIAFTFLTGVVLPRRASSRFDVLCVQRLHSQFIIRMGSLLPAFSTCSSDLSHQDILVQTAIHWICSVFRTILRKQRWLCVSEILKLPFWHQ